MRTMVIAAVAAMGLTSGDAYAGDGDAPAANTLFTQIPGVVAQAPAGKLPSTGTAQRQVRAAIGPAITPGYLPLSSPCQGRLGIDGVGSRPVRRVCDRADQPRCGSPKWNSGKREASASGREA